MRVNTVPSSCTLFLLCFIPSIAAAQQPADLGNRVRALEAALVNVEARLSQLEKASGESHQRRLDGDQSNGVVIIGGNQEERQRAQDNHPADVSPTGPVIRSSSPVSSTGSSKSVPVRGYYRKDGTYVAPHTRSAPSR